MSNTNIVPVRPSEDRPAEPRRPNVPAGSVPEYSEAIDLPTLARGTLYLFVALLAAAIIWCSLAKVDIVVTAIGTISTDKQLMVLQPFDLSIVRDVAVKAGDEVKAGQVLVTLDPTLASADTAEQESKVNSGSATLARSDAEMAGRDYDPSDPDAAQRIQREVFVQRQAEVQTYLDKIQHKIDDLQLQLDAKKNEEPVLQAQMDALQAELDVYNKLRESGDTSIIKKLDAQRAVAEMRGKIMDNKTSQDSLAQQIEADKADYQNFLSKRRRELMESYAKTKVDYDTAAATISKANLRQKLVELKAPADGIVLDVAQRAIGSVVQQAETLITLVPKDATLVADVRIDTRDIGRLEVGDQVTIKLEALPFQKFGYLRGTLRVISPDTLQSDSKQSNSGNSGSSSSSSSSGSGDSSSNKPYYQGRISIDANELRNVPDGFVLRPGMTVITDMKVGQRSVIEYVLNPLTRAVKESMREP